MVVLVSMIAIGSMHDYTLFKAIFNSEINWFEGLDVYVDPGFPGILSDYSNTGGIKIPHKKPHKSRKNPNPSLTPRQKKENKKQASIRVAVENSIAGMKSFHCLTHRIRNHLDIFINCFFRLSAGLWNLKNTVK